MRVGGNHSARVFFSKNGGTRYLSPGTDAKEKYTSTTAQKYLAELKRRVAADIQNHPGDEAINFDTISAASSGDASAVYPSAGSSGSNTPANTSTDDFFSSWDRKKPTPPVSRSQTPISRTSSPATAGSSTLPTANKPTNGVPIRTVNTARIVPGKAKPSSSILTGRKTASSSILSSRSGNKKVVAKKVNAADVDFDEAERAAKEEEEHISKLGYNPNEVNSSVPSSGVNVKKLTTATAGLSLGATNISGTGFTTAPTASRNAKEERKPIKLGFGQTSVPTQASNTSSTPSTRRSTPVPQTDGSVVSKFGNQKAISSDQMFGRNNFDPQAQAEARTRLSAFKGASSISSSSYFGEDEEEDQSSNAGGDSLERMAQDIAGRVRNFTGDDMGAIKDALEQGATKLGGFMRDYLR